MAEKKSRAEKAASASKSAARKATSSTKSVTSGSKNAVIASTAEKTAIPVRLISSVICLGLFVVFLVAFLKPEGALLELLAGFVQGLIGNIGFIVSIPVLLYLFFIHAFSGERPVRMRTICLIAFTLACGCIAHLSLDPEGLPSGFTLIKELYKGGMLGTAGGLLCGGIAMVLHWLCGTVISFILFGLVAIFTLLGGMQITIPSIIRAVQNRPRADWENEKEVKQEPAAVVVNHLANKRIEYIENRRQAALKEAEEAKPVNKDSATIKQKRAKDIIRQIDGEIETPVAVAGETSVVDKTASVQAHGPAPETGNLNEGDVSASETVYIPEPIPTKMLPLEREEPKAIDPVANNPVPLVTPLRTTPVKSVALPVEPAAPVKEKVSAKDAEVAAAEIASEIALSAAETKPAYCFPPIDLLKPSGSSSGDGTAEMRENSKRLNETLASFKIEAHIINVTRGPSVTRYEVELEKGVRLNKLTTAADDIALSLGATGVRIAAVPGKISVVGIEVPNRAVTTVSLREVIDSPEFNKAKSRSSFAVGKDIGGNCIVGNISRLPHMLIAGTTGSGKSVCMNSIIISLLYKASPDDVKLIMVDPKMVELGIYNNIPHLLIPVVTDPKKAAGSLQWAVTEMMRRYKAMSDAGVRDLESYNSIVESQEGAGVKLPQVVVIIDELADLMLVAAKEVEESICRIAQMGRAAGIHLIIATQRPSADVITGLMKANIPSRIAFAVASAMESRIILDTQGAEKLVGKGDMLYAPIGNGKPKRVQGCFVSDPEVEAVATYVKENYTTNYDQQVIEEIERKAEQAGTKQAASEPEASAEELSGDEMLPAAVDVILETGQASVSMLQRRLKLGYARAARIVDEMEEKGIVGPFQGSKPRAILITKEQWQTMKNGQCEQMDFDYLEENAEDAVPDELL